jgi:hypothetical protein
MEEIKFIPERRLESDRHIFITSDLENFGDKPKAEIEIKLEADGFPKAAAFFDIDKTLGDFDFIFWGLTSNKSKNKNNN